MITYNMYKVIITQADFLSPIEFQKKYSKEGVRAVIEDVAFEGTEDVLTNGYTERKLKGLEYNSIAKEIEQIYREEDLRGECLGVYSDDDIFLKEELFTEDDFNV